MKRFFAIILASVLLLTACGKQVTTHHIEDKDWQVVTVQSTQDGSILFIGNSMQEIYPDAAVLELTCRAENGKLTFTSGTQSWEGSYTRQDSGGVEATIYSLTVGDETGPAAVSVTTRQDGSAEQPLVLQLGGYSLYFAAAAS